MIRQLVKPATPVARTGPSIAESLNDTSNRSGIDPLKSFARRMAKQDAEFAKTLKKTSGFSLYKICRKKAMSGAIRDSLWQADREIAALHRKEIETKTFLSADIRMENERRDIRQDVIWPDKV